MYVFSEEVAWTPGPDTESTQKRELFYSAVFNTIKSKQSIPSNTAL